LRENRKGADADEKKKKKKRKFPRFENEGLKKDRQKSQKTKKKGEALGTYRNLRKSTIRKKGKS